MVKRYVMFGLAILIAIMAMGYGHEIIWKRAGKNAISFRGTSATITDGTNTLYLGADSLSKNGDFVIDKDGNVGIKISPEANLHIYQNLPSPDQKIFLIGTSDSPTIFSVDEDGDLYIRGKTEIGGVTSHNAAQLVVQNSAANIKVAYFSNDRTGTDSTIIINKAGWLSIGAGSDPLYPVHIKNNSPFIIYEETDAANKKWHFGGIGGNFVISETDVASRVTVEAGGNVGIGLSDPTEKIDVNGNAKIGSWTFKTNATSKVLEFWYNGIVRANIDTTGAFNDLYP